MNEQLKGLVNRAEDKKGQLDAILAKSEINDADLATATTLDTEINELKSTIQTLRGLGESQEKHHQWLNQPVTGIPQPGGAQLLGHGGQPAGHVMVDADTKKAFYADGECLIGEKTLQAISQPEYKSEFRNYIRSKGRIEGKAITEGADDQGGFLVPEEMLAELIQKKPTPTRVGDMVRTIPTGRDAITIPRVKYASDDLYTTGIRVQPTGEIPATATASRVNFPDNTGGNQFGALRFQVYTQMMSLPVSNDMLEDAMFPLNSWISDMFRQTIDLYKDNMVLNGLGGNQASGILLNPGGADQPAVVPMGNPITADGLLDVGLLLPEQYEEGATYVFNKTSTYRYARKLKDSQNRYLFGQGMEDNGMAPGRPKELGGYPFVFSGFAPNVGANNYPVIFGDLSGYFWIQRLHFSIQVLREIQAQTNQIVVLGRLRVGGGMGEPWKLKIGQQA